MYLPMRKNNFMGMIYHKTTLLMQIEGLLDGDTLFFTSYVSGVTTVYKVVVELNEDGSEMWSFIQDNETYPQNNGYSMPDGERKNITIVRYTNSSTSIVNAIYSATPNMDICNYIDIYIDALQSH